MEKRRWSISISLTGDYHKDFDINLDMPRDINLGAGTIREQLRNMFATLIASVSVETLEKLANGSEEVDKNG